MSKVLSNKRAQAFAFLLINTVIWGLSGPIIKRSLEFVSPNEFLFVRFLIASLLYLPLFFILKKDSPPVKKTDWWLITLLALLGTPVTLIPLYEGLKLTSSIDASIVSATGPLITILGGWLFLKEVVTKDEKIGSLVAFLGTILLISLPVIGDGQAAQKVALGNLLIIGSNLVWTVFLLLAKKYRSDSNLLSLVSYLVSVPVFGFLALSEGSSISHIFTLTTTTYAGIGILFMATLGSIISFLLYLKGQEAVGAGEASVFTYLQPIFTLPLSYFWLHEELTWQLGLGSLIIALGVYLSERRK